MNNLIISPLFSVLISFAAYKAGVYINRKTQIPLLNPLLIAMTILIIVLLNFHIKYEDFNNGGQLISLFLYPATIALALPLYKKLSILKKDALSIVLGIFSGAVSGMICVILLSKMFHLSDLITESLIPKSITTPIGMAVSQQLGGSPSITVAVIIFTGIFGSIIGPVLNKMAKIDDKVAMGTAMGASSHALGTAKAMEYDETAGAASGLTMAVSGIMTVFLAPLLWSLFQTFFK